MNEGEVNVLKRKNEDLDERNKKIKTENRIENDFIDLIDNDRSDDKKETNDVKNKDEQNLENENLKISGNCDDQRAKFDPSRIELFEDCFECNQVYRDPVRSDLTMYLHALSYKVNKNFKQKKLNF